MALKEHDLGRIAERIATDFDGQVPFDVMIAALRECRAANDGATAEELESAVRLQLRNPLEPTA